MDQTRLNELHAWLEAQRTYWQSLLSDQEGEPVDWRPLLDTCRRLAEEQAPHIRAELSASMAEQVRGFCRVGERLLRALKQDAEGPELSQAVQAFNDHLMEQAGARLLKFWQFSDQLNQFLRNAGLQVPAAGVMGLAGGWAPSGSHFRQRFRDAERLYLEFNDALQGYLQLQTLISRHTGRRLLQALDETEEPHGLGDLHALWIDCYEACYREQILTAEYQQAYGRLSNASLALQKLARECWEEEYRALGLVPARDYTQLLEQHHRLRKQHREAHRELTEIRQQLSRLEQGYERLASRFDAQPQPSQSRSGRRPAKKPRAS